MLFYSNKRHFFHYYHYTIYISELEGISGLKRRRICGKKRSGSRESIFKVFLCQFNLFLAEAVQEKQAVA
jgi:hypothetical protein